MRHSLLAIIGAAALSACTSGMTETECASADWEAYGYEDGANGASLAALNDRAAQCGKHGIRVGTERYRAGRAAGLRVFCAPGNGFALGEAYAPYGGQCIDHDEAAFLRAYDEGAEAHLARYCTFDGGVGAGQRGGGDDGRCLGHPGADAFAEGFADGLELSRLEGQIAAARRRLDAADNAVAEAERLRLRFLQLEPDHVNYGKYERRWAKASERADRAVRDAYGAEQDILNAERALAYLQGRIDGRREGA